MRSLTEQAEAVAAGKVSPVELVSAALAAAETAHELNAFTHLLADEALERAEALAGRDPVGPLHGVPVAVKDLYDVRGVVTTGCCAAYAQRAPARRDAAVVERLIEAGAIVMGKTNQHELAFGGTNLISSAGPTRNPRDQTRLTGGSSGGSGAAVAAGVVAAAMGSDTGGSVRVPASFCGVTGLKPTHGAVSLRGAMPLAPSLDTPGPLAATAADCRLLFDVLVGFDPDDPWSVDGRPLDAPDGVERLRVAVPQSFLRLVHPETHAAVEAAARALEEMGVVLDEIEGPDPDEAWQALSLITPAEAAHAYRDLWDDDRVHPEISALLRFGAGLAAPDHVQGRQLARKVLRDFEWALTAADALLVPATPFPAPGADQTHIEVEGGTLEVQRHGILRLTAPVNIAGLPAVAFPAGTSAEGLPLGAQLIGRPWSEEVLLTLVDAYQQETDWHTRRPG